MTSSMMLSRVALVRTDVTRRNTPEETILHCHRHENLTSYTEVISYLDDEF
jgi:hypothetical protein